MTRLLLPALALSLALALSVSPAHAANVLFVSGVGGDTNIVTVLVADGHDVTMGTGVGDLAGDLSEYDAVFWSATSSFSVPETTFVSLETYVRAGGRVFVTGYDSIISNTRLANFCGGSSARDMIGSPAPGPITSEANSLTVGVVDITGVTPSGGHTDRDGLVGLMGDTVEVVTAGGTASYWALRTLGDGEVAWVSNGTYGSPHASWESTAAGGPGVYNAAIRNFANGADSAFADEGAPSIEFDDVRTVDEGAAFTLTATVVDAEGDDYTVSWDLDDDEEFGENEGEEAFDMPEGMTDGTSSMRLGIRAVDEHGNTATRYRRISVRNVDPAITSEPSLFSSVGAPYLYQVEVLDPAGDLDPITYTIVRGPDRMVVSDDGLVSWTPNESEVTRPGETLMVELLVDDGDEGQATQVWTMTVSPNRPPSRPSPIYPTGGMPIDDTSPRLVTGNSSDPDFDDLSYFFEIDTVDSFDSADKQESGMVPQSDGFTPWTPPTALERGRTFYWRVWAFDGTVETEPAVATFRVVSTGEPAVDAGPAPDDAGVPPDAGPGSVAPPRDGGCAVGGPARGTPLAVLLAIGLFVARRRRA